MSTEPDRSKHWVGDATDDRSSAELDIGSLRALASRLAEGWRGGHARNDEAALLTLDRLEPVLQAAMQINREFARMTVECLLEAFSVPAVLVDEFGLLRLANTRAASSLERGEFMCIDAYGRLCLPRTDNTALASREIRRLCGSDSTATAEFILRSPDGRVSAILSIFPLVTPASQHVTWLFAPTRVKLILLRDLDATPVVGECQLRRLFNLTIAESRLAARLATGESFSASALALAIGKETARTHLRAVFAKTGTHRQSELVALLARLPVSERKSADR